MKEKILTHLKTNWKKYVIGIALFLILIGIYSAGCVKGCNIQKAKQEKIK